ncbi:MAG: hypothetical protein RLN99_11990 [Kiloniellaceae bacterium]
MTKHEDQDIAAAEAKVDAAVRAIARLIGRQIAREEFARRDAEAAARRQTAPEGGQD